MSLMTQSLLLEAQCARLDGDVDAAIDLLRTVLSQCNHDLQPFSGGYIADGGAPRSKKKSTDPKKLITTSHMRRVAAYQLALLLLQRSGRRLQ
eukprot:CAMPEP_0171414496 /NCGR_PEP_ID=MMETSP0880-20121228/37539_1 /TAXON_ID=67004 /ORGANISM="Thalassiosira weissflogii, Strain CCMP1336" /LENGTH=92 /DNA_ID=CAMNT_0011932471 /DNA_START=59 /DNA_END=334 /DNA_ORIENTATION=+